MRSTAANKLLVALGLLLLPGCGRQDVAMDADESAAATTPAAATTVFESMVQTAIPSSNLIWELAGNLYGDDGNIDPQKLTEAQWQQVRDAAVAMGDSARELAEADNLKTAPAGVKIQNEGTSGAPGAAQVQAAIDADPQGFRSEALKLASLADEIAAAAAVRDGVKTDDASARLAESCSTCHARYWYPDRGG